MYNLIMKLRYSNLSKVTAADMALKNQNGSIMVIALMVLAIMTVISIMSSNTVVTENFIIRNIGIYKQNVNLVDAATQEGLQEMMQLPDDSANFDVNASANDWLNDKDEAWTQAPWYNAAGRLLDASNSQAATDLPLINDRGENGNGNLRYAFVGWRPFTMPGGGSASIVVSGPGQQTVRRQGRILAEYVSIDGGNDNGFGRLRMEIGVQRQVPIN
jgi:hypothetical protein